MKLSKSVSDRLRSDFNNQRKERCCFLRPKSEAVSTSFSARHTVAGRLTGSTRSSTSGDDGTQDLVLKLTDLLGSAFATHIKNYSFKVKELDAARRLPGWNYCNFFMVKEGLALTYQRAGFLDEALSQYWQLDALLVSTNANGERIYQMDTFFELSDVSAERAVSSLVDFHSSNPKDFSALIHENKISEFDLRRYLFSRQCNLLMQLQQQEVAAKKGLHFIQDMSLCLADHESDLPPLFKEMWAFKAAVALSRACELAVEQQYPPALGSSLTLSLTSSDGQQYCSKAVLGDLYFYAVQKLHILGCALGYLPSLPYLNPDILSNLPPMDVDDSFVAQVSAASPSSTLSTCLASVDKYDTLYEEVIQSAIAMYVGADCHPRKVLFLQTKLAELAFFRGSFAVAEPLLEHIYARYAAERWVQLATGVGHMLAITQKNLCHEQEHIKTLLSLLVLTGGRSPSAQRSLVSEPNQADTMLATVCATAHQLRNPVIHEMRSLLDLSIRIVSPIGTIRLSDVVLISCEVHNVLNLPLSADGICVKFIERDPYVEERHEVTFQAQSITFPPGVSTHELRTRVTVKGVFSPEHVWISVGMLALSKNLRRAMDPLNVEEGLSSLDVELLHPCALVYNEKQLLKLVLNTHEDLIEEATLTLDPGSRELRLFDVPHGTLLLSHVPPEEADAKAPNQPKISGAPTASSTSATQSRDLSLIDGTAILGNFEPHTQIEFFIPVQSDFSPSNLAARQFNATVSYRNQTGEAFDVVLVSDVEFGHPFAVQSRIHALENLGDIFLQCSLQPLTSLPVRLSDVQLRGSPYQFWSMNEFLLEHTLPAGHTFNLLFRCRSSEKAPVDPAALCEQTSLCLKYTFEHENACEDELSLMSFESKLDVRSEALCYRLEEPIPARFRVNQAVNISLCIPQSAALPPLLNTCAEESSASLPAAAAVVSVAAPASPRSLQPVTSDESSQEGQQQGRLRRTGGFSFDEQSSDRCAASLTPLVQYRVVQDDVWLVCGRTQAALIPSSINSNEYERVTLSVLPLSVGVHTLPQVEVLKDGSVLHRLNAPPGAVFVQPPTLSSIVLN
mmetsp:Transcript_24857/g.62416  ORF Transcript_24857/g.62416 Transcript_24857/m.62416 type:complete len:1074 (-) Transcript_24857:646-3867(-)